MKFVRVSRLLATALALALAIGAAGATTYLECDCSPSARGYRANVLVELELSRKAIQEYSKAEWAKQAIDKSIKASDVQSHVEKFAIDMWEACISNWDPEQCVNADVSLRVDGGGSSFCKFQEKTWSNIIGDKVAHRCDLSEVLASEDRSIVTGKAERKTVQRSSESPTPSPSKKSSPPKPQGGNTSTNEMATTTTTTGEEGETPLPTSTPTPFPSSAPKKNTTETTNNGNEGCVAVEHLQGYAMQHRSHLVRPVLCSVRFCATPNHAIIVNGSWTSMKRLCDGTWECIRSVKLVNNLNVYKNRRAVVGDITITPYDLRFPRAGVFLVQALERLMYLALDHSNTLAIAAVFGYFAYNTSW